MKHKRTVANEYTSGSSVVRVVYLEYAGGGTAFEYELWERGALRFQSDAEYGTEAAAAEAAMHLLLAAPARMRVEHSNGDSAWGTYGRDFTSYVDAAEYLAANGGGTIGVYGEDDTDFECQPTRISCPTGLYVIESN